MSKDIKDYQIVSNFVTHQTIKDLHPEYDTPHSAVATQQVHESLQIGTCGIKMDGISVFISSDCEYDDYLKLLVFAAQNPVKKSVFDKLKNELNKDARETEL